MNNKGKMMIKKKYTKKNKKEKYDLIYGAHSVIEMLKAKKRKLYSIYTTKPFPKSFERVKRYLPKSVPNIQYVSKNVLDRMAMSDDHMGIIALVSPFQYRSKNFTPDKNSNILLLDAVQDVKNLGAILRSAHCTGIDGVVLVRKGSAPITAAAHKSSAGLMEHLDIHISPSIQHAVQELKKNGYNFYMSVVKNGKDASEMIYRKPLCLVIGSEATGISKSIQSEGELITLPQKSKDISYNASVAAGILMFLVSKAAGKL